MPNELILWKMSRMDRVKAFVWACIAPVFPYLRNGLVKLGVLRHNFRQPFLIGWLATGRSIEGLRQHLASQGFANHFIAWIDRDETLGIRKLVDFHKQYHLRVFKDNEVRGHYEWTPESRPFDHFFEVGMEERREEFLRFLGDWIVQQKNTRPEDGRAAG